MIEYYYICPPDEVELTEQGVINETLDRYENK